MSRRYSRDPWPVDQPFPACMTDAQLMRVLQYGHARFYRLKKAGAFDRFLLTDPIGHACWSGKKVRAYVDDTPVEHEFRTKAFIKGRRHADLGRIAWW